MSDPAPGSAPADPPTFEASTTAQVGELKLRFTLEFPIVRVTDENANGLFVGNVYGFELSRGPFFRANYAYRTQFGQSELDPRGIDLRRQICALAKQSRDESA